jgi:hypothetical protein
VKLLQKYLGVPQTSVFDQATRTAADAFQRAQGWEPSGVGPATWERLDARAVSTVKDFELADEGDSTIVVEGETDPRRKASYIDNRVEAVGWGLYVGTLSGTPGSFLVYCRGMTDPILLPWHLTRFESDPRTPMGTDGHGDAMYANREEAMKAAPDPDTQVAFFPTAGGMVAPTIFTPNTTPRLMAAAQEAFETTIAEVQAELIVVAFSIVAGALGRYALKRLQRAKPPAPKGKPGGKPPAPSKPPAPQPSAPKPDEAPPKPPRPAAEVEEAPPTPRVVATDEVSVPKAKPVAAGPAADYGKELGTRLKSDGKTGYKALKPIAQDLNAKTGLTPAQKADAAKNAVDQSLPEFGAGPVVEMNGHYVVPARVTGPACDVMIVKPDGGVGFGYASIREGPNGTWFVKDLRIKPP